MSDPKSDKKPVINIPENVPVDMNFERMFKQFSKQVKRDGILEEVKRRRYYIKPSALKKLGKYGKQR
jgi:ribosomal protein S21